MNRKKIYRTPFDFSHDIMFSEYPIEYTKALGIPGTFVKKINRKVNLKDGSSGYMDSAYIAHPDNEILTRKVAVNLEHQSTPITNKKLEQIGKYKIQLVVNEHLPTFQVIVTQTKKEQSKNTLKTSPSEIMKLFIITIDEKNIKERLNRIEKIINNNETLTNEQALNLGIIALFVPRKNPYEILKKASQLYTKIHEKIESKMEYVLYLVLTSVIDGIFTNKEKYRSLINMINANTTEHTKQESESVKFFKENIQYLKEDIATYKENLSNANDKIAQLEAENKKIPQLEAENKKIAQLKDEIEKLKRELGK